MSPSAAPSWTPENVLEAFSSQGVIAVTAMKTIGTEWDICPQGGECYSGYYVAATFDLLALGLGLAGARLLRTPG